MRFGFRVQLILTSLLLALCVPAWSQPAFIRTMEGKEYGGTVEFLEGKVAIKPPTGSVTLLEPGQIRSMRFQEGDVLQNDAPVLHGLKGEYFLGNNFQSPMFTRLDSVMAYWWGEKGPYQCAPPVNFTVRWTGEIQVPQTAEYKFDIKSSDGARLWINNKQIINGWRMGWNRGSGSISLESGRTYPIKIEYLHGKGTSFFQFWWRARGMAQVIVPPSALFPPPLRPGEQTPDWMSTNPVQGLLATYFNSADLTKPALSRIDPQIDFDWGGGVPFQGMSKTYSIRWTGQIQAANGGAYEFFLDVGNAGRLWIDNELVADNWKTPKAVTLSGKVNLQAGRKYAIRLEVAKTDGSGIARLLWQGPQFEKQIVPANHLYPPEGEVTASIVSPEDGSHIVLPDAVRLTAEVHVPGAMKPRKLEYLEGTTVLGIATQAPYAFEWKNAPAGRHYITVRAELTGGRVAVSSPLRLVVDEKDSGVVGMPWKQKFIGAWRNLDKPTLLNGVFTIPALEGRLWDAKDAFNVVYQPMRGDGEFIVRVVSLKSDDPANTAYAGIMIRDRMDNESPFVGAAVSSAGRVAFMHRDQTEQSAEFRETPAKLPLWLKVSRRGDRFTVSISPDGKDWTVTGSAVVDVEEEAVVGMVSTCLSEAPASASFDHVALLHTVAAGASDMAGVQMRSGTFIPGRLKAVTDDTVTLAVDKRPDREVPRAQIARLIVQPFGEEQLSRLAPGTAGVLLAGGDFAAGEITELKPRDVGMTSLLFGPQQFDLRRQVLAVVFHDVAAPAGFRVIGVNHVTYIAPKLRFARDKLVIEDPALGTQELGKGEIQSVERIGG